MTKNDLEALLAFFPPIDLPITLTEDLVATFSKENDALPASIIEDILLQWEEVEDEYVEFVPCFRIDGQEHFTGIVYWRAGLLRYEFILVTFDKDGQLITRKPLSTVIAEGDVVKKSIAQIDSDLIIHIMAGQTSDSELNYDPSNSQAFNMEIMPTGEVEFSLGD